MLRIIHIIILLFLFQTAIIAQHKEESGVNLSKFYKMKLHFGFSLMYNQANFISHNIKNSALPDTVIENTRYGVKSVYTKSDPGFALGIISDVRLHEYLRLRFTPNISFASRALEYTLQNKTYDTTKIYKKNVESTFLIFPLELKLQSKRLDNFGAYLIGGGGYTLDLASKKKATSSGSGGANQLDEAVKIKRDDYFYSVGLGTDFYLQYFKLGLELKFIHGTKNLLQKQNNIFSNSIDKVNSKMVVFSITFEG